MQRSMALVRRLVQTPADGGRDLWRLGCVRPGKLVQPVEHSLQCHKRAAAIRAVVNVAPEAASVPGRQIAVNEVRQAVWCPLVIAAEPRAGNEIDHRLWASSKTLDLRSAHDGSG